MARPKKISVICVTYNAESCIGRFLESYQAHASTDCELIIQDGNSSDRTAGIVDRFKEVVTVFRSEPDRGIYDAMNKAVRLAQGQWVYFVGADDRLTEEFKLFADRLAEPDVVYHGDIYMGKDRIVRSSDPYQLAKYNISHQTIFYPAAVFELYSYDEQYPICADYALNLQLRADRRFRFQYIPYAPAIFGMEGTSSAQLDTVFERQKPALIKRNLGMSLYLRFMFRKLKHFLQGKHVR